jgi:hypothetical protein
MTTITAPPAKTAKTGTKPKTMPSNIGVKDPKAPATAVNLAELSPSTINLLHMLLTSAEPVTSVGGPPTRAMVLTGLMKRGLAELTPSEGTAKTYTLSDRGRALCALLWPDAAVKTPAKAPAKRTRKPAAKAEPVEAEAADSTV